MTITAANLDTDRVDPAVFVARCDLGAGSLSVAVKDCIDIQGLPTRLGSVALADAPAAAEHADVVRSLLANGVRIVGKTGMHEFAYGVTGLNGAVGSPVNPRYPDLIPGGSSSGSAVAVAAGLCDAALGTDTGGSVRVPAACCGVLGLKPTYGRVSREGVTPAHSSLDCVGVFARDAAALSAVIAAITPDWRIENDRAPANDARPQSVGWLDVACDPRRAALVRDVVQQSFGVVATVSSPHFEAAYQAGLTIIARETHAAFSSFLDDPRVGADVADRLSRAGDVTDAQLAEAEAARAVFTAEVDWLLEQHPVLALPTVPGAAPRVADAGDLLAMVQITRLSRPFNLSGHPAIAIPLGGFGGGPASLQLVGRKGDDETLVRVARRLEPHLTGPLA